MAPSANLRLATRQSPLALWQSEFVAQLLAKHGKRAELVKRSTDGDRIQDRFLHEIGGKGLFIRELEKAMLEGQADAAVHSLKDLPVHLPKEFFLPAILPRHSSLDAIIWHPNKGRFLPRGKTLSFEDLVNIGPLTVATGSLRRRALLKPLAPAMTCVPIRGNVDTRLHKLKTGLWDAIILAEASLERLQLTDLPYATLDPEWFVPCAGQGAIAVEAPANGAWAPTLQALNCPQTQKLTRLERRMLAALGGDCTMPCGIWATAETNGPTTLRVVVLNRHGESVRIKMTANIPTETEEESLVAKALGELRRQGLYLIDADLKRPWNEREV